jgi:hypothetical protein
MPRSQITSSSTTTRQLTAGVAAFAASMNELLAGLRTTASDAESNAA